jgi:secreted trypsin-like serine protease
MKDRWPALLILAGAALASGAGWSAEIPGQISVSLPAAGQGAPSQPIKLPTVTESNVGETGAVGRVSQDQKEFSICAVGITPCRVPIGTPAMPTPKLVGDARPASDVQYGFIVAIYYTGIDRATYLCSGTLLTSRLILTAGHCGCGIPGTYWVDVHQNAHQPAPSELHYVDGPPIIYDQSVCRYGDLSQGNDLALVRLRDAVDLADKDQLDTSDSLWTGYGYPPEFVWDLRTKLVKGTNLVAIGYGYTSQQLLGVRMQAEIPIFSFDCEEAGLANVCAPFAEMILADAPGRRLRSDTCGGDSGGPVFRTENGRPRLVAVTSRAAPGLQDNPVLHCGGGGIYTLIGRKSVQRWLAANGVPPESNAAAGAH